MDPTPAPPSVRERRRRRRRRRRPRLATALLLLPVLGLAAVPAYDRFGPRLLDVPFFYWYQLAWLPLAVACMAAAAHLLPPDDREGTS